jgi:osmotically-inducible protein OsmY
MIARTAMAALAVATSLAMLPGCAVTRGQQSVGASVDDAAVTTAVKAKLTAADAVDAGAISVETLNGTVLLAGFAKTSGEKMSAESLTRGVNGVRQVENRIVVRS